MTSVSISISPSQPQQMQATSFSSKTGFLHLFTLRSVDWTTKFPGENWLPKYVHVEIDRVGNNFFKCLYWFMLQKNFFNVKIGKFLHSFTMKLGSFSMSATILSTKTNGLPKFVHLKLAHKATKFVSVTAFGFDHYSVCNTKIKRNFSSLK